MKTILKGLSRQKIAGPKEVAHKKIRLHLLLSLLLLLILFACGSDEDNANSDSLGIGINDPTHTGSHTLSSREEILTIGGFVYESPLGKDTESVCQCIGFACFFDPQCTTFYVPRVDVTVTNKTTGGSSRATIAYSREAPEESSYRWSASVSLMVGENRIVASADDGSGNRGSDDLLVINP